VKLLPVMIMTSETRSPETMEINNDGDKRTDDTEGKRGNKEEYRCTHNITAISEATFRRECEEISMQICAAYMNFDFLSNTTKYQTTRPHFTVQN
jgi:hypothetical protein